MKTHHCIRPLAFVLTGLIGATGFATLPASADPVFSFGPTQSYVEADTEFARNSTLTGDSPGPYTYLNAFSDTNPLSPTSGYSGPVFYGGYIFTSSSVQGSNPTRLVVNNSSTINNNDALRIYAYRGSGWAGSTLGFASVYLFKQADFVAPYNTGTFSPDGFSVTYRASGPDSAFVPTGRWVVQIGDTYYVSQATITAAYNTVSTVSLSGTAFSSTQWAAYNPTTSLNFNQSAAVFSPLDLSSVTGVGIYFEQDAYLGTAATSGGLLAISAFSVTGTVTPVPEPATLALLFGLIALGAIASKRRARR
ncbi:PEP-CTERM sorting domain-containing protein [Opitutaceae bacterium TAV4]|nr:PEP-CTERM sorting domain-containing protein [Opitutaceae bacterium TAV4]RRK01852.1 PEP-CTERM sorting domain-containing protein [Opitutaceae bacterium TAV3]